MLTTGRKLITKQKIKGEDVPVTTSRKVAEVFGKRHSHVIEALENLMVENSTVKSMFTLSTYKVRGRDFKQYLLTQDGFTLLAMGFTGAKALEFKLAYIQAFNDMRVAIEEHKFNREIAKEGFKGLTGALRAEHGDNAKMYHFSNEADMLNRIVLGLSAKQYCDIHKIDRKRMRDYS